MPNLRNKNSYCCFPKAFVNISASCNDDITNLVVILPATMASRIKWQSTSICLVRSWNTGFCDIWRADWLSQWRDIGVGWDTPRLSSKALSLVNSHVVMAIDRYSASAEERETMCCFLVFQDTGELPRKTIQPVSDRRVRGQPAQSASHHPCSRRSLSLLRNTPWPGLPLRYLTTRRAASQCASRGHYMNWDRICTL